MFSIFRVCLWCWFVLCILLLRSGDAVRGDSKAVVLLNKVSNCCCGGGHSIVYQVVPQNKFVFVLLDRLVVLFCGRVDVQSSY